MGETYRGSLMWMDTYTSGRSWIHDLLDPDSNQGASRLANLAIMGLILLSVVAIALETVDRISTEHGQLLRWFEITCVSIFTIEYLLRIWSITESDEYEHPIWGRLRYAQNPYLIIDLLAILPFYLGGIVDLRFIRILRLFRIFRVLKIARYSNSLQTMGVVVRKKKPDLVIAFVVTSMLMVLSSSALYFAERGTQPDDFSSIPESLWWSVLTLSTVGYGDVVPQTVLGQFFAGITAIIGVGLFGLPASILAAGFIEEATRRDSSNQPSSDEVYEYRFDEWVVDEIDIERGGDVTDRAAELAQESEHIHSIHLTTTQSATAQSPLVDADLSAGSRESPDTAITIFNPTDTATDDLKFRMEVIDDGTNAIKLSITSDLSSDEALDLADELRAIARENQPTKEILSNGDSRIKADRG